MHRAHPLTPASMKPLLLQPFKRPWQWLLLLLIGTPFAWAAGVSINNLVITTVKQLSFAQAKAEVNVNQQFTQTATVRLSPGAVTYSSSDAAVATVNAQTGEVTGVLAGEATITATQAASPPYLAASASYTIRVKGQPAPFNDWTLASMMYGASMQITPPTSNVQGGTIVYSLEDPNTTVARITKDGLITATAVGSTWIVATRGAFGVYDISTVKAKLEVTAVPGLNGREIPYTTTPIDLLPQLGGQNVTYTSSAPSVATIIGTGGQPQVSLRGLGETVLEAKNTGGVVVARATWKVVPGQPNLTVFVDRGLPLPSTTFDAKLLASSNSQGTLSFSIPDPIENSQIAEVNATTGQLWVKGPGTVQVKVIQAASGPWSAREVTLPVTIGDGLPGVQITDWPRLPLKPGNTFDIGYRVNFVQGGVQGYVAANDLTVAYSPIGLVSHTPPSAVGAKGYMRFQVTNQAATGTYHFVLSNVTGPFAGTIDSGWTIPALVRELAVDATAVPKRFNLGAPLTVVYGEKPVLPKSYDQSGAEITDGNRCTYFSSSNPGVLRGVGIASGSGFDKDHWETAGVGVTQITCYGVASGGPAALDYDSVTMEVIGADPRLQGFPRIEIGMDSLPYTLEKPASLNPTNDWRFEIVPLPGEPATVATLNGNTIVPVTPGKATIRVTQGAGNNFREAFLETTLNVTPAQDRSFAAIQATYGDPDFLIPRPAGYPDNVSFEYLYGDTQLSNSTQQDVFQIVNGTTIRILNAGRATILAKPSVGPAIAGEVIVAQATPKLLFYIPPRVYGISACGEVWNWPIKNAGTNNTVGGSLITNSDGAVYYPMGAVPGWGANKGPNPDGDYWRRAMGSGVYVEAEAPWLEAWVELGETRNFKAARSETLYYGLWASSNRTWSESRQMWLTACFR